MAIEKIYKKSINRWVPINDSVSDLASNIELDNVNYLTEEGDTVNVSEAFGTVDERLDKLEKNVAYLYKNGTLGSGGSGGGLGGGSFGGLGTDRDSIQLISDTITLNDKNYVYINGQSTNISFYVKAVSTISKYYITVTVGGVVLDKWNSKEMYSLRNAPYASSSNTINVTGIENNTSVVISAIDVNGNELDNLTVYIRPSTYNFSLNGFTNSYSFYYNEISALTYTFNVTNAVPNSSAIIQIKCQGVATVSHTIDYATLRNWTKSWYFTDMLGTIPLEENSEYNITAELYITSIDTSTPVDTINFSVSVASSKDATLVITGTKIDKSTAEDDSLLTQYVDENVNFNVKVLDQNYPTYYLAYKFYYNIRNIELDDAGNIKTISANERVYGDFEQYDSERNEKITVNTVRNKSFNVSTFTAGVYYMVVKAWAVDGNGIYGITQKTVKGKLENSDNTFVYDYNEDHTLAVQFNAYKEITDGSISNTAKTWNSTTTDAYEDLTVTITQETDENGVTTTRPVYDYDTIGITSARTMSVFGTNGDTSGFITNELSGNAPALRLSGKSYANIPFSPLFPAKGAGYGNCACKMQNYGFTISLTFKSDKHPDANGTILDIGDWTSSMVQDEYGVSKLETTLSSGIHIGLDEVLIKFKNGNQDDQLTAKLIQNELTTVDIVYEQKLDTKIATFKLYLNGVCTSASYFSTIENALIWAESVIWLGCRNRMAGSSTNTSLLDRFCDVNIYDFKIYASALNEYAIVRNYINARARVELIDNSFDWALIKNLRDRNYMRIDSNGKLYCSMVDNIDGYKISDKQTNAYNIYEEMVSNSTRPIPIIHLKLSQAGFYDTYHTVYSTEDRDDITKLYYNVDVVYTPETGGGDSITINANTDALSDNATSPYVSLQGTSTLTYAAKNLELYFGTMDGSMSRLFTPKGKTWLPENRFTLKADVVDSSHCNNASIGKFINESGVFDLNPAQENTSNPYRSLVKHTLEGFPCYLFITYNNADNKAVGDLGDSVTVPQFMGIYSFNLGRGAYYNTGFEVLEKYELDINDEAYVDGPYTSNVPAVVKSYTQSENPYPNSVAGCISYECDNNDNEVYSFQQDSDNIINNYYTERYPGTNNEYGFKSFKKLFTILANCYSDNEDHEIKTVDKTDTGYGSYYRTGVMYDDASTYYTYEWLTSKLNWSSANSYYLLAMALGLVDSLGKNSTYRSWDISSDPEHGQWYCCFYDMDTGLGLNNSGQETVEKTVYTRKIENIIENGFSNIKVSKFNTEQTADNPNPDDISSSYSTWNSRLWNVVTEGLINKDGNIEGNASYDGGSFRDKWALWRTTDSIFSSSDTFVEKYYKAQIKEIGEIMYNMDYKIKYINPCTSVKYQDARSISFLHGRRSEYVANWLRDRLYFLDSIFYYNKTTAYKSISTANPMNYPFFNSAKVNSSTLTNVSALLVGVTSAIPCIWYYTVNESTARVLLYEDKNTSVLIPVSTSNAFPEFNLLNMISSFENFGEITWTNLSNYKALSITDFDLSNTKSLTEPSSFGLGEDNIFRYMTELRSINLQNTKMAGSGIPSTGLSVDISKCNKLLTVDISNSHVSSITFPSGGCLTSFQAQNSLISSLSISNQPFMSDFNINNCNNLKTLELNNCSTISNLNLSGMPITSVTLIDCSNLTTLDLTNCTSLRNLVISGCYNLKTIKLNSTCTGLDAALQDSVVIDLRGCRQLKTLDATTCYATKIMLNGDVKTTLTSLKLNSSHVYKIQMDDEPIEQYKNEYVTDLSVFTELKNSSQVTVNNNTFITYLRFRNTKASPFVVNASTYFTGCSKLTRVFGHIEVKYQSTFRGLKKFYINEIDTYTNAGMTLPNSNGGTKAEIDKFRYTSGTNEVYFEGQYDTNIKFNDTLSDFSYMFNETFVSIYDVYYALSRADKIQNLKYCFQNCTNIETNDEHPLSRYTFSHCKLVTDISSIFYGCTKIYGPIFSATKAFDKVNGKYDGLYSPLEKCTSMTLAFYNTRIEWVDTHVFYKLSDSWSPSTSVLGSTNSSFQGSFGYTYTTSVVQAGVDNTPASLKSGVFLKYIPKLRNASSFFGYLSKNVTFEFQTAYALNTTDPTDYIVDNKGRKLEVTLLFHNNPYVTNVSNCFPKWKVTETYTAQSMIFKGQITATLFGGGRLTNGVATFKDPETGEVQNYAFPKNITKFGGFLRSTQAASKPQFRLDWDDFDHFFDNQIKSNITDACQIFGACDSNNDYITKGVKSDGTRNTVFPIHIFEGMTSVTSLGYFFCNHGIKNGRQYTNEDNIEPVLLPGDMFKDCYKLNNIEYIFKNTEAITTGFDFYVKLTSEGFINCPLDNVQYSFSRVGIPYSKNENDYIGIPYKFFFMGYNNETVTTYQINFDEGDPLRPAGEKGYFVKPSIKATITNMSGVFEGNSLLNNNKVQYSAKTFTDEFNNCILDSNNKCGDLIDYNTNYDPRPYLKKDTKVTTSSEILADMSSMEKTYFGNILEDEETGETTFLDVYVDTPVFGGGIWNSDTHTLSFTIGSFYSRIGNTHASTEWMICGDMDGNDIIKVVEDPSMKNSFSDTEIELVLEKSYYLFVRFIDNEGNSSDWLVHDFIKTTKISITTKTVQVRNPDYNPLQYCWNAYSWDGIFRPELELLINEGTAEETINPIRQQFRYVAHETEIHYDELNNEIFEDIEIVKDTFPDGIFNNDADKYCANYYPGYTILSRHNVYDEDTVLRGNNNGEEVEPDDSTSSEDKPEITFSYGEVYGYSYSNYMLPSDIFRYVKPTCSVDKAFSNLGHPSFADNKNNEIRGNARGRIQPLLFKTLSGSTSFSGLFEKCYHTITPWLPARKDPTKANVAGEFFADETFDFNTALTDVSNMFTYLLVLRNTKFPYDLFRKCTKIQDASYMLAYSKWGYGDDADFDQLQVPFSKCGNYLKNLTGFLTIANPTDSSNNVWQTSNGNQGTFYCGVGDPVIGTHYGRICYINNKFMSTNRSLTNVEYLFNCQSNIRSSVCEIWNSSLYIALTSFVRAFYKCTNIRNYSDIPEGWKI